MSATTPRTDALIEDMLHGDGIPQCDEWDRLRDHASQLERELKMALEDARGMKACWDAACNDIAKLLQARSPEVPSTEPIGWMHPAGLEWMKPNAYNAHFKFRGIVIRASKGEYLSDDYCIPVYLRDAMNEVTPK